MKKLLLLVLLFLAFAVSGICMFGEPIIIEVKSNKATVSEALQAAKSVLLESKFVAANGIQESSFTATRTTGAKADYYVADVSATTENGKVKLTITFTKIGTGLLSLRKIAAEVKSKLEKQ
ncbi:hypothetical protein [Chitinophaga sp.]|uniref:hypothetical protein n=1 Tax=Chitinophaga sp. TaxID=1869181 RepID=UPI002F934902